VLIGVSRDVTDRKRAEVALNDNYLFLQTLIQTIPIPVFVKNRDGKYMGCNKTFETFFGRARGEIIGKTVYDVAPKEVADEYFRTDEELINYPGTQHYEWRVVSKNGLTRDVIIDKATIMNSEGEATGIVGVMFDITDRKRAEEALLQLSDRLSLATRAGGVGIWDYDVVHNTLIWDDQMFALYGITREEFGGAYEAWQRGIHPDDRIRGDEEIQKALHGEKEFNTEFRVLWPDGSIHNIRALALVERDAKGIPLRMIGTNWDITQTHDPVGETDKSSEGILEE
jgi:PAS domain S-box-containing protein